jgi:hypothetical protein
MAVGAEYIMRTNVVSARTSGQSSGAGKDSGMSRAPDESK